MGVVKLPAGHAALKRLQLELSEDELRELDVLAAECGIRTRKDLFNNAITLLRWSVRELQNGREVASIDREQKVYNVLHMPIFDNAKRQSEGVSSFSDMQISSFRHKKPEVA